MAAGQYGQITAQDPLNNLSSANYYVGYLPSTLSSIYSMIISTGNILGPSTAVTSAQLASTTNSLLSTISTTDGKVNTLSSYLFVDYIPTQSTTQSTLYGQLNSSFQGYVAGTSITQAQLFSTTTGVLDTVSTTSNALSTFTVQQVSSLSNYVGNTFTSLSSFSNLA
jgi:hypothetical protein